MSKLLFLALGLTVLGCAAAQEKAPEKAPATRTLKIKLNYTGSGTVDEKHKIFLFLFDSADFMQGQVMPIAFQQASAKDATVAFEGLTTSPVYATAVYDPSGEYEGMSAPPSGASMGLYSKTPGTPEPIKIEPGETVTVELAFDDTAKMP